MRACLLDKRKSTFFSRYLQTKHFLVKVEKNEKSDTWQNVKKKKKSRTCRRGEGPYPSVGKD